MSSRRIRRNHWIALLVLLALATIWQVLSMLFTAEAQPGEPMVPGWQVLVTRTFISMSDYFQGGFGVKPVSEGGTRGYLPAMLSLLDNSADTLLRLTLGWLAGAVAGALLGLAVSWSTWSRRLVDLPAQFLRTLPLLAMVPLFQLWFGSYFIGKLAFVAYGVGVLFFAGVVNAVANVPQIYIDNARTLGAGRLRLYVTVVLPAILPELRSTMLFSLGAGWAAVLGAEYLGAQSGLGYIIVFAQQFAFLDRMFLVALLVIIYTSLSFAAIDRLTAWATRWAPGGTRGRQTVGNV